MERVEVIPGLIVDEEMYERAVRGLEQHAPGEKLTWEAFTDEHSWLLVPDPDGAGYKGELVVRREEDCTIKINLWMAPDLRAGAEPAPITTPGSFAPMSSWADTPSSGTRSSTARSTPRHGHTMPVGRTTCRWMSSTRSRKFTRLHRR